MKNYKEFERIYIGDSDVSALTCTFIDEEVGLTAQILKFGGDSSYHAYLCIGDDVEIGEHYHKVISGSHWLKIFDDREMTYTNPSREYKLFDIYRSGDYGTIIHWHN